MSSLSLASPPMLPRPQEEASESNVRDTVQSLYNGVPITDSTAVVINGCPIFLPPDLRSFLTPALTAQFSALTEVPGALGAAGLPDIHLGHAFPVGSVLAIDPSNTAAAVPPEGIGFDINCGVRCLVTNLTAADLTGHEEEIADRLHQAIPLDSTCKDDPFRITLKDLNSILDGNMGVLDALTNDIEENGGKNHIDKNGALPGNSRLVSQKAKGRGLTQLGTLGSGNHYVEVQIVDRIYDAGRARVFGLTEGTVVVAIHTGSRGVGHVVCTEAMKTVPAGTDRPADASSLATLPLTSEAAAVYLATTNAAANFAWANRRAIHERVRVALRAVLPQATLRLLWDTSHNMAMEETVGTRRLLVMRKGAARVLPPNHHELPAEFRSTGQPVPVGGSMGTCSFILAGAPGAAATWFSTCHGAGRVLTRGEARAALTAAEVAAELQRRGVAYRGGSATGMVEEAPGCYKDVEAVAAHSERVGLTVTVARLRPVIVVKG